MATALSCDDWIPASDASGAAVTRSPGLANHLRRSPGAVELDARRSTDAILVSCPAAESGCSPFVGPPEELGPLFHPKLQVMAAIR